MSSVPRATSASSDEKTRVPGATGSPAVVAQQATFPLPGRRSVLVGFWQGPDMKGLGQPGLHLHGVTGDRRAGGHVLSCVVGSDVQVSVQRASGVVVHSDH